ncbi:MAG TPA: aminotransferase class V-fold PLP-dependent enzyme [Polyangiaceae bacterium]|nr:aminotransferase class V-fold PLP-dependent enzyme [Polyangiaceae bacterium]
MRTDDSVAVDWAKERERFPAFAERNYLASACMGPVPKDALADIGAYARSRVRGNRSLEEWLGMLDEMTGLIAALLEVPTTTVAIRDSATACHAAFMASVAPRGERNRVVVSALDFHSSLQLYAAQRLRGFEVIVVPPTPDGSETDIDAVLRAVDERTALVSLTLVSRYGGLTDVSRVAARALEVGALSLVDVYPAIGVLPIRASNLSADAVVGGVHKWLSGSTGCAFLHVRDDLADRLEPAYPGWFGHASLDRFVKTKAFEDEWSPRPGARRFQQGSPCIPSLYSSRAGVRTVLELGPDRMAARSRVLLARIEAALAREGLSAVVPAARSVGALTVRVADPERVVHLLEERGIDVDQRRNEVVRVSPHPCSTEDECDAFVAALAEIVRKGPSS